MFRPATVAELQQHLAAAHARGEAVPGADLRALDRVFEYTPEDLTVTTQAGLTLAALQAHLGQRGQWLPLDPPRADTITIADALNWDASGPRRFGCGTAREHLIGLKVVLADGRLIKSGGKVVKNVAGYDLAKLFVGARGTLGVIVEATFKVLPRPEAEAFVAARSAALPEAAALIERVRESALTPVVLDLHNLAVRSPTLVLGFAGTREEVDWQLGEAAKLGVREPASLDYERSFWTEPTAPPRRLSVLPTRLTEAIQALGDVEFVARAGNGEIYHRGGPEPPAPDLPVKLMKRVKEAFDPKRILPEFPL
jgi:FAD/FMN-containing dehydrogenase